MLTRNIYGRKQLHGDSKKFWGYVQQQILRKACGIYLCNSIVKNRKYNNNNINGKLYQVYDSKQ